MKRKSKSKQAAQPDKKPYVVGGCDTWIVSSGYVKLRAHFLTKLNYMVQWLYWLSRRAVQENILLDTLGL